MASQKYFPARNHGVARRRMRARQLALEGLERRYALSAAPTTTPAGLTIGETLASVVDNAALGGIQVQSVTGFAPGPGANYLLLTQPITPPSAANPPPFALVSYAGVTNTDTTQSFTSLALAAGNGNTTFKESTLVTQAASSTTTNSKTITFGQLSNPTTNSLTVSSGAGFIGTGYILVNGASSVGSGGGGSAIFSYNTTTSSPASGSFKGLKPVGSVGLNEAITATVTGASASAVEVTYTAVNTFQVGQTVSITGLSKAAFNLQGVTVTKRTSSTFTVANTTKIPTGSAAGTAASTATFVQGFNFIQVLPGSIVIEACAPTPGATIVAQPFLLPTKAGATFKLAVLNGLNGFAKATSSRPGSAIVTLADGSSTIVTYTGNTQNGLLGCTVKLLPAQSRQILRNAPVLATANAPVTFTFTNKSFPKSSATTPGLAVYAAIAGQQSDAAGNLTYGYLVPQQTSGGKNDFTKSLQFVSMASSPPANVPTFQLFAAAAPSGSPMSFKVDNTPNARMVSTRIVFGMGLPPVVPINSNKPAFPAMSNPSDPNNRTNFDFLEFTMRNTGPNDGTLFVNTTQVDQVGLPFTMNVTPGDSSGASNGVGVMMGRADLANAYATFVTNQFLNSEQKSISPAAELAFQGLLTPYRLLNPSDAFTNPPANYVSVPTLDGYFDAAVATFFANYTSGEFRLQRDGYSFIGTTKTGYRPAAYEYDGTLGSVSGTTATLTLPASGGKPAAISLGEGVLVTGAGITGTAVVTGQPSVDSNNVTTVTMAGEFTTPSGSSTYTFTAPGEFTVLELEQADASWTKITGGQNYRLYAPYFFKDSATAFPTSLPVGSGIGSLALSPTSSGSGYTANSVRPLTFTGGGGSGATGFYVTDNSGTITAVGLTSPGSGYTSMPTIGFSGPTPTRAAVVTASAMPAAPPWVAPGGPATVQSAGSMTFGCLGVFADGGQQAMAGQITGTNASGQTLSDIQNTIVSAFNRGVANSVASGNDVTAFWNTAAYFYPKPVAPVAPLTSGDNWSNLYAAFLHQSTVSVARPSDPNIGLAYGFAYDDQGGNSTTLTSSFPQSVNVTFQPWQSKRYAPTPLVFQPGKQPSVSQNKLTATLQGLVNKTYRWQLYQVATPASAAWTPVGQPTSVPSGNLGRVLISAAAPSAGTYVLVAWAADITKNDSPTATAAAIQFGGQYAVSPRFTVPASQLRVAATPGRVAGLSAARQPVRWAAVGR